MMSLLLTFSALALSEAGEHGADAAHASGLEDPKFWVGLAFLLLIGLFVYLGVHRKIAGSLDARATKIRAELDEARTLKEEAQHLLAQHQRKQREAAKDAEAIIEHAREEATIIAKDVRSNIDAMIERRTRLAQERIAQAEAAAVTHVRAAAVEVATASATRILEEHLQGDKRKALTSAAINDLSRKLH